MQPPADDTTITAIENRVTTLMADKLDGSAIVTRKYLTPDNRLITLTVCSVAESTIPRQRIQLFNRVEGGVMEHSYALFVDRRFEVSENPMIFGQAPVAASAPVTVDEPTATALLASLENLTPEEQHLT